MSSAFSFTTFFIMCHECNLLVCKFLEKRSPFSPTFNFTTFYILCHPLKTIVRKFGKLLMLMRPGINFTTIFHFVSSNQNNKLTGSKCLDNDNHFCIKWILHLFCSHCGCVEKQCVSAEQQSLMRFVINCTTFLTLCGISY